MYFDNLCSMALPHGVGAGLQCVIVVFPGHTHLLFLKCMKIKLHMDENITSIAQPRGMIPFHLRENVENELDGI